MKKIVLVLALVVGLGSVSFALDKKYDAPGEYLTSSAYIDSDVNFLEAEPDYVIKIVTGESPRKGIGYIYHKGTKVYSPFTFKVSNGVILMTVEKTNQLVYLICINRTKTDNRWKMAMRVKGKDYYLLFHRVLEK